MNTVKKTIIQDMRWGSNEKMSHLQNIDLYDTTNTFKDPKALD